METLRRGVRDLDFTVLGVLLLLAVCGCVAVAAATHSPTDPYIPKHTMEKQMLWEVVGVVLMFVATTFDYRSLKSIRWWLYGGSTLLLLAVFGFPSVQGAHSWINLKVISVQPSELAKLTLIIWLAGYMADREQAGEPMNRLRDVWPIIPITVVPFLLIFKEPALGQALVVVAIAMTMFTVFAKNTHFVMLMLFVVIIVVGFSLVALKFPEQSTSFINNVLVKHHILKAYQVNRITTWLNPNYSTNNYGYNIHMSQIAVGSGQLFGEGLFSGIETNGGWVPNQWDDYIYTAIGEEFGFVGTAVLVLLFLMLMHRFIKISKTTEDAFGTYIVIGITGMFSFQVFENIGMDMYLSPSTGITLPFISYGGTSLAIDYLAVGLILSVGLRRRSIRFE
ncbi:FtsW/RodA/SpoVE family cell cycle protein [Alicyclobacillus fastidiosus]|uniref:FtsW/RodA/SpoVE family cell cycle protein n=1 Tax=Alicyclobacillus fastidiosus TaxID=392011 RepID=A0ABV5ABD2_9BACL|nr:FtsW/RodA/SpoVE family cell cycle protein [Alicyclobacillus fastidiosus]WEH07700.1 FtsW/RodA/SpoVE family cell cycle protein [Alicyclobacillus fastidiosus]